MKINLKTFQDLYPKLTPELLLINKIGSVEVVSMEGFDPSMYVYFTEDRREFYTEEYIKNSYHIEEDKHFLRLENEESIIDFKYSLLDINGILCPYLHFDFLSVLPLDIKETIYGTMRNLDYYWNKTEQIWKTQSKSKDITDFPKDRRKIFNESLNEVCEGILSGLTTLNREMVRLKLDYSEPTNNYNGLLYNGIKQIIDGSILPSKILVKFLVDANLLLFKGEAISLNY